MSNNERPSETWYKEIWNLDTRHMPRVENTQKEIDFITDIMDLSGTERILDLACGFGRHCIELARRGYSVTGIDITPEYIEEAQRRAAPEKLDITFICADIRDFSVSQEYDVVLNIADGAIGYLEDDDENLKIFDLISSSLKKGGKHFMQVNNAEYAEVHLPSRNWEISDTMLLLTEFRWEKLSRRMLHGGWWIKFNEIARKPETPEFNPHSAIRLYSLQEIEEILKTRKMTVKKTFGSFDKTIPSSHWELELLVCSEKL